MCPWTIHYRADSRLAHNQSETSLKRNGVSQWLGAHLESALSLYLHFNINVQMILTDMACPKGYANVITWRHNGHDGASNHQPHDCLPIIQAQIKESIKATCHWPLWGDSPVAGEFPSTKASNAESVSIWWRHHGFCSVLFRCGYVITFAWIPVIFSPFTWLRCRDNCPNDIEVTLVDMGKLASIKSQKHKRKPCSWFMRNTVSTLISIKIIWVYLCYQ